MNTDGHERIAELVNWGIGKAFPEAELKAGSSDPDTKQCGRSYVGPLSKHHYDPGGSESGRYHGTDTIAAIVIHRCRAARSCWLANRRRAAAFEFGVATHFFMDGLICSPSVDDPVHTAGDLHFARATRHLMADPVNRPDEREFCAAYLNAQLGAAAGHFGRTDPADVKFAYVMLVRLGYAVTAPDVPALLQERSLAARKLLEQYLQSHWNTLSRWVAEESLKLPEKIGATAREAIDGSRFIWFSIAVTQYRQRGEVGGLSLSFLPAAWFGWRICRHFKRPFREALQKCLGSMNAARTNTSGLKTEWDTEWYPIAGFLENHRRECARRTDEWTARAESSKSAHRTKMAETLQAWKDRWVVTEFPSRWANSFPDQVGHNGKFVAALCVGALATAGIVGAVAVAVRLVVWALVLALPLCFFALFAWRLWRVCAQVCERIWHRGEIHCPHCRLRSEIEALHSETTSACPVCGKTGLPILLGRGNAALR
jgi:hypothetical protein